MDIDSRTAVASAKTEAERIRDAEILPDSFFEEEIRCDFLVTKERKKIWAIELDLLLEFDRVCKEHNLTYFLSVGTLLGAVRHKGFIPWDDDIDVEMPRNDYERLQNLGSVFSKPYFLQTPYTDKYYAYSHIRLRNTRTTCFPTIFAYQPMCHGIFIDIFPLDLWNEQDEESNHIIDELNRDNSTYMRMLNPNLSEKDRDRVAKYSGKDHLETYEQIQRIAQQYNNSKSQYYVRAVRSLYSYKEHLLSIYDYSSKIKVPFEGYLFTIPTGYHSILQTQFGRYEEFPPIEIRGKWHESLIFEPDVPYEIFLNQYRKTSY